MFNSWMSPSRIYSYPRTRFVADFIGTCNLFDGAIAGINGASMQLALPGLGLVKSALPADAAVRYASDYGGLAPIFDEAGKLDLTLESYQRFASDFIDTAIFLKSHDVCADYHRLLPVDSVSIGFSDRT